MAAPEIEPGTSGIAARNKIIEVRCEIEEACRLKGKEIRGRSE
jgi:hypothetical protein